MRWDLIIPVLLMYVGVAVLTSVALKRVRDSLDYMLAGRQLGYGLIIPHIIGAFFGAGSTIGVSALAYIWGFGGSWYNMAEAIGLWLLMAFMARRFWHLGKRLDFVTLPDLLESYYGKGFKAITGLFIALGYMSWVAGQIVGGGRVLETITGFPLVWGIILATALVGFYAGFGGLWGSVFADLIFGSLTVIGAVLIAPILIHQVGGWDGVLSKIPANYLSFFWLGETKPVWGIYGWTSVKWFIWYLMVFVPAFAIGQLNIQRIYACKTEKVAAGMSTFIAAYVMVQPVFFAVFGMVAFALNPALPSKDAAAPWVMANAMSTPVAVVFLCSVMATILSCAAAGLNVSSSSIVRDIWKQKNPNLDELKAGRIASLTVTVLSLVFALALPDVVGWLALGFTLMSCSLFIPTVVIVATRGRFTKWATPTGAIWSTLIGGGAAIVWKILTQTYGMPFRNWDPVFIGLPISVILFFVISAVTSNEKIRKNETYTTRVKTIQEVFDEVRPCFAFEGKDSIIVGLCVLIAIFVMPRVLSLF
jgi:SSS family solute:Na+ symporter